MPDAKQRSDFPARGLLTKAERWLYPGGRPNGLARPLNRGWAIVHTMRLEARVEKGGEQMSDSGSPARYEIRVEGALRGGWAACFEGLQVESDGGETVISGLLADQPALHGLLVKVRDLGLCLICVRRLDPDEAGPGSQR